MSDKHAHDDDFDGIKEEDNPMPDWWLWTFLLTIPFAFIYFIHFHMTDDNVGLAAEYRAEKAQVEAAIAAHGPKLDDLVEQVDQLMSDETHMMHAMATFKQQCAVCHGQNGEGLIGPNLTDKHFIHGADSLATLKVINEGVLSKGMPAWGQVLSQDDLVHVSAYVRSLAGKMLQGKPPEGEESSN